MENKDLDKDLDTNLDTDLLIAQYMLEEESHTLGIERYKVQREYLEKRGLLSNSHSGRVVLKDRVKLISKLLEEKEKEVVGQGGYYNKYLSLMKVNNKYDVAAFIGLQVLLNRVLMNDFKIILTPLVMKVAREIEKELVFVNFEKLNAKYLRELKRDLEKRNITDVNKRVKAIKNSFEKFEVNYSEWDGKIRAHLGSKVIDAIMDVCSDLFYVDRFREGTKTYLCIESTDKFYKWSSEFEEQKSHMLPVYLPTVVPPLDYDESGVGGYYGYRLQNTLKFVRNKSKAGKKFVKENDPKMHREAVNKLQKTAYRLNEKVYETMRDVYRLNLGIGVPNSEPIECKLPPFPVTKKDDLSAEERQLINEWRKVAQEWRKSETKRKSKILSYMQMVKIVERMKGFKEFYFPHHCDFRGRIYCVTNTFSPQGSDMAKGCLEYAKGKRIGYTGIRELAINLANKFGISKCTREERYLWTLANEEAIRLTVQDPIENHNFWSKADDPYQFLAACFEWQGCDFGNDPEFLTRLPCGLDGSCNGLQHYSAMLRDEIGAEATNLTIKDLPADIYGEVAYVCNRKLSEIVTTDERCHLWQKYKVSRKCAKRPVMTSVYGATKQSCREYIKDFMEETGDFRSMTSGQKFESSVYLADIMYESIGEVVKGARKAMDWLRSIPVKQKDYIKWLSPVGFPVYQHYSSSSISNNIRTHISGDIAIKIDDFEKEIKPNTMEQKNGIAPNFVHSLDAAHLVLTVLNSNLDAYTMIHDDFGTYACDVPQLKDDIRKAMYKLYSEHKPLNELAEQLGIECNLKEGDYRLEDILQAEYFFD